MSTSLPRRGTASEVAGIVSATMFRKTVRDNRIVTPVDDEEESMQSNNN